MTKTSNRCEKTKKVTFPEDPRICKLTEQSQIHLDIMELFPSRS